MIRILLENDQPVVKEYLDRHHIETTFLAGNLAQFGLANNRLYRRCGDYYGYFENQILTGVIAFYNMGSVTLHFESDHAIPHFATLLRRRSCSSLVGMRTVIQPLYEAVKADKDVVSYHESGYYINRAFVPYAAERGEFINVEDVDQAVAARFVVRVYQRGFKKDVTAEVHKIIRERAPEEDFVMMRIDGKLVAQALVQTFTSQINQIGVVYTVEEERGRGYCKALVSEMCRRIQARGKIPTLMVRNDNEPAVRAYTALGFDRYDDYLLIGLKLS